MPKPFEAYREGYERGKKDSFGELMAEATMGMLRDDPGGYFQKGYNDGAAGRKFNPPPAQVRPPAADVNPFDDKVAIKTVCPNCGAVDWFEWKFLGKLKDPICGHSWFAGSGAYALMQLRATFAAADKGARYMNAGINFEGAQIFLKPIGWFCGAVFGVAFRLPFGLLMIPIQALAALTKARTGPEIAARIVAFVLGAAAFGLFAYKIENQDRQRFQPVQPAVFNPIQTSARTPQTPSTVSAPVPASPSTEQSPASTNPAATTDHKEPVSPSTGLHDDFSLSPLDPSSAWTYTLMAGDATTESGPNNLRITCFRGSNVHFTTKRTFAGNFDLSFTLNKLRGGSIDVGIVASAKNIWIAHAGLNNDLLFSLNNAQPYLFRQWPPDAFIGRDVAFRLKSGAGNLQLFADDQLLDTEPFTLPPSYRVAIIASLWPNAPTDSAVTTLRSVALITE